MKQLQFKKMDSNVISGGTYFCRYTSLSNKHCCPPLIYPKLNIWATRVDKAEVNSMASHTGQLVGCWRAEGCIVDGSGYIDTGQQLEGVTIPQSDDWIRKASYRTLEIPCVTKLLFSVSRSVMHTKPYNLNNTFHWPAERKKRSSEENFRHCTSPLW